MGPPAHGLATGLAQLALAAAVPVAVIWLLAHLDRLADAGGGLLRRLRPRRAARAPASPPVERLAEDLRRLSAATRDVPRGTSRARHLAVLAAYDDVLGAACRALDVPHMLAELPPGMDRDLERLRVEGALESAGLRFAAPRRRQDTP